jgi:hypothetical protein
MWWTQLSKPGVNDSAGIDLHKNKISRHGGNAKKTESNSKIPDD